MSGKYTYLFSFNFENDIIKIYRNNKFLIMEKDNVTHNLIKGITIENDVICSKIILNNSYVYLPDIKYENNNNIIQALIQRDIYIEMILSKEVKINKDIIYKKNLSVNCKDIKYNVAGICA
tara:strand:+ start:340 stop:702 length:363 start_codon:yes stop_codon:yes gene_type:complete